MKKAVVFLLLSFTLCGFCFSQEQNNVNGNVHVTVEISNIVINGGKVYLVVFLNAESFKKEVPEIIFEVQTDKTLVVKEVSIPRGEFVVFAFQDANNNQKLDSGLFGIPKELFGISNYFGKGLPSRNFDKQKILIDEKTGKIILGLYKL